MGKGRTGSRSLQRKPCPDMEGRINKANLTAGNSDDASGEVFAEARLPEEPGGGKPLSFGQGRRAARRDLCGGRAGDCPLYRDGRLFFTTGP